MVVVEHAITIMEVKTRNLNSVTKTKKIAVALLTNCALAKIRINEPELAKFDCTKALSFDASNFKAFFHRTNAELALGDFDDAAADAAKLLELDPANKEAERLQRKIEIEKRKSKQKEKAMFSKMF